MLTPLFFFFFFNDTATTEIYPLSLHDALPILGQRNAQHAVGLGMVARALGARQHGGVIGHDDGARALLAELRAVDGAHARRSEEHTSELQSPCISYAVFCLKKKKIHRTIRENR